MIKNKQFFLILMMLVILFFLVESGCSRSGRDEKKLKTITFWHSFTSSTLPVLEQMIVDFEKANPDIKIKAQYVPTGDALVQKLISAIQSHTVPDIAWVHADFLDKLVEAHSICSIQELAKNDTLFWRDILPDIFPQLLKSVTIRDTLYALPMEATTLALLYNRDMFRKAGLDPDHPPQSHAELDSFTRILSRDLNGDGSLDQYGFYVPVFPASGPLNLWMIMQWTPFVWQEGGEIFYQNKPVLNSQAGIHALNLWKKLYQMQHFERFSMAHDMGFMSQTVGMILDGPWNLPRYKEQIHFDWAVAPLPAGKAGKATYLSGEYLVVFKKCGEKLAAWKFLQWFMKKDVQRRFAGQSGYLPVRKSLLMDEEYRKMLEDYPQQKAFHTLIEHARGRQLPDRFRVEINQILANAIEHVVRGGQDPGISLEKAESKIYNLLDSEIK